MRVLFCGDREWTNVELIAQAFDDLQPTVVIEGEARGADRLSRAEAERRAIPVLPFPAEWEKYGKAAGVIRNQQMLDEGKPDLVVAFHNNIEQSKGTGDMVRRARRSLAPIVVVIYKEEA